MISGDPSLEGQHKPITILREQGQLVLEICHFTQDLNPLWDTRELLEALRGLSKAGLSKLDLTLSDEDKFAFLSHYFFEELGFRINEKPESLQDNFLPQVLSSREGPSALLMLLFCSFCEEAGIRVQVTSCRKRYLLKVQLSGHCHIVDFGKNCEELQPYEIVDLINSGFDFSTGTLNSDMLVVDYLHKLKKLSRVENRLQILSVVHSYLMRYQPFNLKHLSERAVVAYETGDYKTAIDDIRSYFQYKQPEFNNLDLKRIYKSALKRMRETVN